MNARLLTMSTMFVVAGGLTSCSKATPEKKMNVIYILADDLGYGDLACTGSTKIETLNIDRLRTEGMLFTQHYSGSTVSAPSRSTLMTGQHTGHTPIRGNMEVKPEGQTPMPADTYTMAEMFKSAGYATGAFGKWGLGFPGSEGDPVYQGFDRFFGYNCQRVAHRYYPKHLWDNLQKIILEGNAEGRPVEYAPDIIHAKALEFINMNRDNPFFLFLPYIQPHAELLVPEDGIINGYRGRFPENPFTAKSINDNYGPNINVSGYCSQDEPHATFAAMVGRLDKYVGDVISLLKELGLDKNTIIMFSSDNGPHREGGADPDFFDSYGQFRGVKRDMYEGGIRLPLIAWAPGTIAAGSQCDHVCAFWDMLPTFAEVAGAKIPGDVTCDGISVLPTLTGKGEQEQHDYLYWEFHEQGGKIAVRMDDWKAVKLNVLKDPDTPMELYDLAEDIHEDNNVADEHPDIVHRMEEIMKSARTDSEIFTFKSETKYI